MTSLLTWAAVDSHGPTSVYMASDSRISWRGGDGWNNARKVFASRSGTEIFGYCGDVVFPSLFLAQAVDLIDAGLVGCGEDAAARSDKIACLAQAALASYPEKQRYEFTIVHCIRTGSNMAAQFFAFAYGWDTRSWTKTELGIPTGRSDIVSVLGSGTRAIETWQERWNRTKEGRTSRAVFGAFCDSLNSQIDPRSGGPPQLVAIHRSAAAKTFGIIWKGNRYLLGLPVDGALQYGGVDWRNALFERCDGGTMLVLPDAQQHRQPRGLALTVAPRQK